MNQLSYTSVYQMTYLFLETLRGALTNKILNDSFQPFLVDLNTAIKNDETNVLEAAKDCIVSYYEPLIDDHNDVENFTLLFKDTVKAFDLEEKEELAPFFNTTLKQLLRDILDNYAEADNLNQ
jgi:hypothetical protein